MKIMMTKCTSWKKITKATLMTNMTSKKTPSCPLDKILEPYPKWKTMPNNSTMHPKIIRKISIFSITNSPNHISHQLKVLVPHFLLFSLYRKIKINKNPKIKKNKKINLKAMKNGKLIQNKNNKLNSKTTLENKLKSDTER